MNELDRISQAETYINRYFEFEDAVTINEDNKEYLKTYIKDVSKVVTDFDVKKKITMSIGLCALIGIVVFVLFLLILGSDLMIVSIIAGAAVFVLGTAFVIALNRYRLTAAKEHQIEVNEGIKEQIDILDSRKSQLERQRDDYFKALGKKIDFMELDIDYMKNIGKIKEYIVNGSAETCEDAVDMFEQSLLMEQMTSIISKSEVKPLTHEENLERFGDPLKVIKENKKKRRKEKKGK
ncbi:MAG: hypothetical protein Q4E74_07105 [Ruminococcus sp.]|nr:hypothetical protein [Ruminococcus sp.]